MSDYQGLDEATLQQMLADASSYEERSGLRKALREIKKSKGQFVGRSAQKGGAGYNRFAGGTAAKNTTPKSFIPGDRPSPATKQERSDSRGSSTPSRPSGSATPTREAAVVTPQADIPPRPPTPTPPPTPEEESEEEEEPDVPPYEEEEEEPDVPPYEEEEEEPDVPPYEEEEEAVAPPSPPPPHEEPMEYSREESPTPVSPEPSRDEESAPSPQPASPSPEVPIEEPESPPPSPEVTNEKPKSPPPSPEVTRDESPTSTSKEEEPDLGRTVAAPRQRAAAEPEFTGFRLRKTVRETPIAKKSPSQTEGGTFNFGVKLRSSPRDGKPATTDSVPSQTEAAPSLRQRSKTYAAGRPEPKPPAPKPSPKPSSRAAASGGAGPRTMRDYQELSAKSKARGRARFEEEEGVGEAMSDDRLHSYLVAYVNRELSLHPALPSKGKALFDTCSNPAMLCKLINRSVPNTVDMRVLTRIPPSAGAAQRREALEENMTLVVESGRAIGCRVDSDDLGERLLEKDPHTIRSFLVDLIRARVVHMPGMDEEPSSTFTNMSTLFEKIGVSVEEPDGAASPDQETTPPEVQQQQPQEPAREKPRESPPRDMGNSPPPASDANLTYEERRALRRAERDKKAREKEMVADSSQESQLSYEERSALRRAERERRRREREGLLGGK